jgi:hypothetical protein
MQPKHWKDAALAKAEAITDAWEVVKAYAGRAAEWVLFVCMIINIVQMLPGVAVARWVLNLVLGVQVVMLDIGGLSLSTMSAHARALGDVKAAKRAGTTSAFLIGLMIVTLLLVSIGLLFPIAKPYTDLAEKGLILIRVVMTVVYSHVIHSLRSTNFQPAPVPETPAVLTSTELQAAVSSILIPILEQYHAELRSEISAQVKGAMQNSVHIQEVKQPQVIEKPRLRQFSTPVGGISQGAERQARLVTAYRELLQEGIKPTGQTLSARARCNRAAALAWLRQSGIGGDTGESEEESRAEQA